MTTNELKDAAIFVMAYSFLKMDSTQELGLFINKKSEQIYRRAIGCDVSDYPVLLRTQKAHRRADNCTRKQSLRTQRKFRHDRAAASLRSALFAVCAQRTQGAEAGAYLGGVFRDKQRKDSVYLKQELRYEIPQRSRG